MTDDLNKRNKQEWIESAAILKAEPYEIAGALFDCTPDALFSRAEVAQRLDAYLRPTKDTPAADVPIKPQVKKAKEETVNDNSAG